MKDSLRFGILLAVLIAAGILVNTWAYLGEAHISRHELKDFPMTIEDWKQEGGDQHLDAQTLSVLRASDYLLRSYRRGDGRRANLYVGYYQTQRDGATYHSPLNCLPGSGWRMENPSKIVIPLANGKTFEANKYVIENGSHRELMIYWYQGRGRIVSSEYWGKIYTVLDSVRLRRSDAAMVRVTAPLTGSDDDALKSATHFATITAGVLPEFVPN